MFPHFLNFIILLFCGNTKSMKLNLWKHKIDEADFVETQNRDFDIFEIFIGLHLDD